MRILPLSDLHHELWRQFAPQFDLSVSRPDVVVLAGDINTGAKAIKWATETFKDIPVIYVHGNHEAYGHNLEDMQNEVAAACQATAHIHFLNCREFVLGKVRFLGATLWTNFKLFGDDDRLAAMREAEACMSDYKRIRLSEEGYRKLCAADTEKIHSIHRNWLQKKLEEPFAGSTVVVTHMAPSKRSVADRFVLDRTSAAYASNLDDLAAKADLWIHGHMHESFDYQIGACRVVCNPCGYMTRGGGIENDQFNPNLVIEMI